MESSSSLHWLSFRKDLRDGQVRVFRRITPDVDRLNIKLPTGYGKTFTMCGVYSILKNQNRVDRLLAIFPSVAQIDQFKADGRVDLTDARVDGPLDITDIQFFGANAIKHHRMNTAQVFVTTIQALIENRGMDNCRTLMQTGRWMIAVDEYQHYGMAKSWGKAVQTLPNKFLLAMSATPFRPNDDSAFGKPDITVTYRVAKDEGAVKSLLGHAYNYLIDTIMEDGTVRSFTTAELVEAAGGDSPEQIEKLRIKRKMRWSPKYVSPLIDTPIVRMLTERVRTGLKLQALIGAMCVSHAELVCKQISEMFPELRIEWVGTGPDGRSDEENRKIIKLFCPSKTEDGIRPPAEIDILVHVGKAGEGLDTTTVSEVVFLNNASICNKKNQEAGRAGRYLEDVTGHISFDSSCEYRNYTGDKIMDAIDELPPKQTDADDDQNPDPDSMPPELPEEPTIMILNMKLINIDSGDPRVQGLAHWMEVNVGGSKINFSDIYSDLLHPDWDKVIDFFQKARQVEASRHDRESEIKQWQDAVGIALSSVTGRVVKTMMRNGTRFEKSLPGDIKKRINTLKKSKFGEVQADMDICRQHYNWLKQLEQEIIAGGLPSWLS